jgi:hypothetical protein
VSVPVRLMRRRGGILGLSSRLIVRSWRFLCSRPIVRSWYCLRAGTGPELLELAERVRNILAARVLLSLWCQQEVEEGVVQESVCDASESAGKYCRRSLLTETALARPKRRRGRQ